jgi:ADP-ribose pyrophosphatase YjhB (NUDIX family)
MPIKPQGTSSLRFCGYCGSSASPCADPGAQAAYIRCPACGRTTHAEPVSDGPALLVLTAAFADNRMLLMKRGLDPYRGSWAPPGGFVERGESLEHAAVREVDEEVGISIPPSKLIPHGLVSVPSMNQVYVVFVAVLDHAEPLRPTLPEVLDAKWFAREEYPLEEIWEPANAFDIGKVFDRVSSGKLEFLQQGDDWARIISNDDRITYLWRR